MTELLILGDSFCRWRETDKHWPFLIDNKKQKFKEVINKNEIVYLSVINTRR